ncbi:MAG: hypothetical protein II752_06095 [Muribaculaceae bacterium]|nr:hypothetical protein [Muribaculaceae bacterium]
MFQTISDIFGNTNTAEKRGRVRAMSKSGNIVIEPEKESYYQLNDLRSHKFGDSGFSVDPFDALWLFAGDDAETLSKTANTERIRAFLPGLNFSSKLTAEVTLSSLYFKSELGLGFVYMIRRDTEAVGMIIVESPKYNAVAINLRVWTVEFFLVESVEHIGLMYNSLKVVLGQLKRMGANCVMALCFPDNKECANLMKYDLFESIDEMKFTTMSGDIHPSVCVANFSGAKLDELPVDAAH